MADEPDLPVPWAYYLATGITAVIACFLSAVQGEAGIFFRVREILITVFKTDVHPLWVFIPAFLLGAAACWVERPKNSRSVLIAGLASFSLFGFTPYSRGTAELEGRSLRRDRPADNLVLQLDAPDLEGVSVNLRDADFRLYQRVPQASSAMGFFLPEPGRYWLDINGGERYRSVRVPVAIEPGDGVLEKRVSLEGLDAWQAFWQKFQSAPHAAKK